MDRELITKHLELVIEANKTTNITRISSFEEGMVLHVEDSLSGLLEVNKSPEGLYGDMGSGAGFPGIPLAIETGRPTVLIDSVGKKAVLLQKFADELGLDNVSSYGGRLEELAAERPGQFSVLTARALSKLGSLMELAAPLLKKSGRLICYKSHIEEEELAHAISLEKKLGLKLVSDRDFYLSDGETYRRIVTFEKVKKPTIKLPRHVGYAQKKPL
jgi:16S rRNA (guanine527-N7)-methyltransferase